MSAPVGRDWAPFRYEGGGRAAASHFPSRASPRWRKERDALVASQVPSAEAERRRLATARQVDRSRCRGGAEHHFASTMAASRRRRQDSPLRPVAVAAHTVVQAGMIALHAQRCPIHAGSRSRRTVRPLHWP